MDINFHTVTSNEYKQLMLHVLSMLHFMSLFESNLRGGIFGYSSNLVTLLAENTGLNRASLTHALRSTIDSEFRQTVDSLLTVDAIDFCVSFSLVEYSALPKSLQSAVQSGKRRPSPVLTLCFSSFKF
jgi:hypothetical protein